MKKYKLTNNTKVFSGRTLYQIEALENFGVVEKGELGGYIESEENLSQEGNAWVYDDAKVYGNAWVYGSAVVCGNAMVYGNAEVYGDAWVCGNAWVYGNIKMKAGLFFGWLGQNEEVKTKEIENGERLVYKGEADFIEDEDVEITVEGKTKMISRRSAKELGLL